MKDSGDGNATLIEDLGLAIDLAQRADEITMNLFADARVSIKHDRSLVTEADLLVEREAENLISRRRPNDSLIAEEWHRKTAPADRCWAIDPIDHTNNYARGLPVFGTLIALLEHGTPVVGVISAPAIEMRWWASKGAGAWANNRPVRVSNVTNLAEAHMSFSQLDQWDKLGLLQQISDLTSVTRWAFGSGGFPAQMWLAEGKLDIALDSMGCVWDLAASQIIVEEAGGAFTDLRGNPTPWNCTAVVTNGILHDKVLSSLQPAGNEQAGSVTSRSARKQ